MIKLSALVLSLFAVTAFAQQPGTEANKAGDAKSEAKGQAKADSKAKTPSKAAKQPEAK